jgi:hypothetical protein
MNLRSAVLFALLVPLLAGCGGQRREWPSLMTPAEKARAGGAEVPAQPAASPPQAAAEPAPAPVVAAAEPVMDPALAAELRAAVARLREGERELEAISKRWKAQKTRADAAAAAVAGRGPADEGWSKAQLELTRLNQIAAELDDLQSLVERGSGTLAIIASGGGIVQEPLIDTGTLLRQVMEQQTRAKEGSAAVRAALARR